MRFLGRAKEAFDIKPIVSDKMTDFVRRCGAIYEGMPEWIDAEQHIGTVNFAKAICSEVARLTMLGTKITIDGSARAKWLQDQIDSVYFQLRGWVEHGCAYGTVILKPNGNSIDAVTPDRFIVTDTDKGKITGVVFVDKDYDALNKKYYTRLEYHRFEVEVEAENKPEPDKPTTRTYEGGLYRISNRCYVSDSASDSYGDAVAIERTPWKDMSEDVTIENVTEPLYGVLRMPAANNIDIDSPLGMPVFADAIGELRDLDVAYSRMTREIYDSKRTVMIDSDILSTGTNNRNVSKLGLDTLRESAGLPDYVKIMQGNGANEVYHEINPSLNTDMRITGINALLSQIGYKVGFANGYFVFNEQSGIQTATGVEADQQRTIQLIKDMRDAVEHCLDDLIAALDAFASLYGYAPVGAYEVVYDFGDITYNRDEDRARWLSLANSGVVPKWMYLVKFEGMTEEEAKAAVSEAQNIVEPEPGEI